MDTLVPVLWPELLLVAAACVLFLLGLASKPTARRFAAGLTLLALVAVIVIAAFVEVNSTQDAFGTLYVYGLSRYITLLTATVGVMLVLLAWPSGADAMGNSALEFGYDAGEFYALMLLSLTGVLLVASTNDIILLFLGLELASIPTYIMVSISRPVPAAQEAGVKYFFLGAMAAALMLFGFSYLYGTTGQTHLDAISTVFHDVAAKSGTIRLGEWQLIAVVLLLTGFAFKIAAFPLHEYAGDVYQGAATPVTAFLAFVPKTSGMVAILKILYAVGGAGWQVDDRIVWLLWIMAVLTMSFGNVLALLPFNIKRVLAYSSVAHSGYMLVGVTALVATPKHDVQIAALTGVLFYLAAYGIMNTGAFGVLMALPARDRAHGHGHMPPGGAAETYEDIAGQGRNHVALGLAMTVCCLSLTGIPLTIGFWGKVMLIKPALAANAPGQSRMVWLVVIMMINAAISAGYYLKIVARMFLGAEGAAADLPVTLPGSAFRSTALAVAICLSVFGTLLIGAVPAATNFLSYHGSQALLQPPQAPTLAAAPVLKGLGSVREVP